MKKIVLSLAVLASVALVSCNKGEKAADSVCDTTATEVVAEEAAPVDTAAEKVEAAAEGAEAAADKAEAAADTAVAAADKAVEAAK